MKSEDERKLHESMKRMEIWLPLPTVTRWINILSYRPIPSPHLVLPYSFLPIIIWVDLDEQKAFFSPANAQFCESAPSRKRTIRQVRLPGITNKAMGRDSPLSFPLYSKMGENALQIYHFPSHNLINKYTKISIF